MAQRNCRHYISERITEDTYIHSSSGGADERKLGRGKRGLDPTTRPPQVSVKRKPTNEWVSIHSISDDGITATIIIYFCSTWWYGGNGWVMIMVMPYLQAYTNSFSALCFNLPQARRLNVCLSGWLAGCASYLCVQCWTSGPSSRLLSLSPTPPPLWG